MFLKLFDQNPKKSLDVTNHKNKYLSNNTSQISICMSVAHEKPEKFDCNCIRRGRLEGCLLGRLQTINKTFEWHEVKNKQYKPAKNEVV